MRGNGSTPEDPADLSDRTVWQLTRAAELPDDDIARFLDLAGYADGRLDADDRERVAERLAHDPEAASDIAAARALSAAGDTAETLPPPLLARACALVGDSNPATATIIPFAALRHRRPSLSGLAQWSSLAAAVAVASWLGFTLGVDTSRGLAPTARPGDEGVLNELFEPASGLLRDLTEPSQT